MLEKYNKKTRTVPFQESTEKGLEVKILVLSLLLVRVPVTYKAQLLLTLKSKSDFYPDTGS